MTTIKAIETRYAGCRFRSRLEARWAVFFDQVGISWQYEPQGFVVDGRAYLPDFLLPDCGTWVEVKGAEAELDKPFLVDVAASLPFVHNGCGERGPQLMVLGPIPNPPATGDLGWVAINSDSGDVSRCGFGTYPKNNRPWWLDNGQKNCPWLTPTIDPFEWSAAEAYLAARQARFEHGECG